MTAPNAAPLTVEPRATRRAPLKISLVTRLLVAIVVAGLLPLAAVATSALIGYHDASNLALNATTRVLDDTSLQALQLRTEETAHQLGHFLDDRAGDARTAALLPADPIAYASFAAASTSEIWYPTGTSAAPGERREEIPLYREVVALDGAGNLIARIVDNTPQADPGDPARLAGYLAEARALGPGELAIAHLSRTYLPRSADEATGAPGADYATFDGVYRFLAARRAADGSFAGAVMLALDARHVMEYVVHIASLQADSVVVWPDHNSGGHAYLFDDQGWTIAHPRLWTVRGDDANGRPVPPVTAQMSAEERNRHPFNVLNAGWADPNLPTLFAQGRAGESGFVITNQDSARRATTYAPVPMDRSNYASGVFGVLAIGANMDDFHRAATTVASAIDGERRELEVTLGVMVVLALALLVAAGWLISRTLSRPLVRLTDVARRLEQGTLDEEGLAAIRQRRFADEATILADVFAEMGRQVVRRERQLRTELADLHIQIDTRRRQQQVEEITETDYFRNLRDTATKLRSRGKREPGPAGDHT